MEGGHHWDSSKIHCTMEKRLNAVRKQNGGAIQQIFFANHCDWIMWISISSSETCWNYYLAGLHVAQPCRYCFYSVLLLFTLPSFLLVLKLLVILYSSDTQYSFGYFTVKTKAYNIIISHIVQLWLLFKKLFPFVWILLLSSTTSLQSLGRFLWATRYITVIVGHILRHDSLLRITSEGQIGLQGKKA